MVKCYLLTYAAVCRKHHDKSTQYLYICRLLRNTVKIFVNAFILVTYYDKFARFCLDRQVDDENIAPCHFSAVTDRLALNVLNYRSRMRHIKCIYV